MGLASRFYHVPGIVPPAPVVAGLIRIENLWSGCGIFAFAVNRAEDRHAIAGIQLVVEYFLLFVGFAGKHQNRPHFKGRNQPQSELFTVVVSQG